MKYLIFNSLFLCLFCLSLQAESFSASAKKAHQKKFYASGSQINASLKKAEALGLKIRNIEKPLSIIVIPPELRGKEVRCKAFVEAVAKYNHLKIAWYQKGHLALFYRDAWDKSIKKILKDFKSKKKANLAAWAAGWTPHPDILDPLLKAADSNNEALSKTAFLALYKLDIPKIAEIKGSSISKILVKGLKINNIALLSELALAFGNIGDDISVKALKVLCRKDKFWVRQYAYIALGNIKNNAEVRKLLIKGLDDLVNTCHYEALFSLAKVATAKELSIFEKRINTPNEWRAKRFSAILALGYSQEAGATKILVAWSKKTDKHDRRLKQHITEALARQSTKESVAALVELAKWVDWDAPFYAIANLDYRKGNIILPILKRHLNTKAYMTRGKIASTLAKLGTPEAVALIQKLFKQGNIFVNSAGLVALAGTRPKEAEAGIFKFFKMENHTSHESAFVSLGIAATPTCIKKLTTEYKNASHRCSNSTTLKIYHAIGGSIAFDVAGQYLNTNRYWARSLNIFAHVGRLDSVPIIEKYLEKEKNNKKKVIKVASTLLDIGGDEAVRILVKISKNSDVEIRMHAIEGLATIGGETAMLSLIKLAKHKSEATQAQALNSIIELGGPLASKPVVSALKSKVHEIKLSAIEGLASLNDTKSIKTLEKLLRFRNDEVRVKTAISLAKLGSKKGLKLLLFFFEKDLEKFPWLHDDLPLRDDAIQALGMIGGKKAFAIISKLAKESNRDFQSSGYRALGELGTDEAKKLLIEICVTIESGDIFSRKDEIYEVLGDTWFDAQGLKKSLEAKPK